MHLLQKLQKKKLLFNNVSFPAVYRYSTKNPATALGIHCAYLVTATFSYKGVTPNQRQFP